MASPTLAFESSIGDDEAWLASQESIEWADESDDGASDEAEEEDAGAPRRSSASAPEGVSTGGEKVVAAAQVCAYALDGEAWRPLAGGVGRRSRRSAAPRASASRRSTRRRRRGRSPSPTRSGTTSPWRSTTTRRPTPRRARAVVVGELRACGGGDDGAVLGIAGGVAKARAFGAALAEAAAPRRGAAADGDGAAADSDGARPDSARQRLAATAPSWRTAAAPAEAPRDAVRRQDTFEASRASLVDMGFDGDLRSTALAPALDRQRTPASPASPVARAAAAVTETGAVRIAPETLDEDCDPFGLPEALAHRKCAFVAKLRFAFQTPSKLFLAMDYYPAGSLDAVLESRAFRRKDARAAARRVGAELAAALGRVHELCVLHRDLKPSNVLVDAAGHVALSDFGLATRVGRPGGVVRKRSFAGTVNYAAPELLLKSRETYGGAVDCWALGCLLHEMLAGAPPFRAPTARETFARIAGPEPAPAPGDVDEDCATTLAHLLEKDPGRRLAAAKAPDSRWCTLDFAALDREPGPLASIAAVITECAKMDDDELDPSIADLFAYDGGGDGADADAFAGFGRAESVAERPSDATNVFV
ncbi:protein serine/threonine kinase [Aureococcus anophagefferens]|uniref:Protein serine/threonine kinase n=2 Tax=Aureococcus anophagefferens TaxID=44056 RepID=A0ABR1FVD5_AURAN